MAEPANSNYPASLDDTTSLLNNVVNMKTFVLDGALNNSATTVPTTGTISGITAPGYLLIDSEIIHFGATSGVNFTSCTRGADSTTAAAHDDGAIIYHVIAANYHNQLRRAIIAIETELGVDVAGSFATLVIAMAQTVAEKASAAGDLFYATAANAVSVLAKGGYGQYLGMNSGATTPAWTTQDGWIPSADTWTYASTTTFTIAGVDRTSVYTTGTKLKCTNTTAKNFYVVSSAFSTNTTVTVTGGSAYALADGAITVPHYSYADNPQGFLAAFGYTPTGISDTNVTLAARFHISGRRCFVDFRATFTGGITFTTMPTLPITASASLISGTTPLASCGTACYYDIGTAIVLGTIFPSVVASATTFNIASADGTNMSATSPITWANGDLLDAHFSYEL